LQVRVRFAPSPTGKLHIGGLRVAIFNWLFARHFQGSFLLRIEDTDLERSKQEHTDSILKTFKWIDMNPDESVVIQSSRIEEHKQLIDKLLQQDKVYKCFCAIKREDLDSENYSKYNRKCRDKVFEQDDLNKSFVIRFKLPDNINEVSFDDLIHGKITFNLDQLDDFIIARSDGAPMYNFVVVADDAYMKISHVIRGEDHISNTPKQILLYKALDYNLPKFAHVPLILDPMGGKLSKRNSASSVEECIKMGYLPDALFNYLVRLGWSHGDQEIFTRDELIKYFSLDHVGKSGAAFDIEKMQWVNNQYISKKTAIDLLRLIQEDVEPDFLKQFSSFNYDQIIELIDVYKERAVTLQFICQSLKTLDQIPKSYSEQAIMEWIKPGTLDYLKNLINELELVQDWTENNISDIFKQFCKKNSIKISDLAQPVRLALIGETSGIGVFKLLFIFSKEESMKRLYKFLEFLNNKV